MRKITSLLMLFCAFVGTAFAQVTELSQLSNDKIYAIKSGRCFLLYSEANADKLSTSTATAITDAERVEDAINNPNQQFKIQKTGENYYLYSVGAGKYLAKDGSFSIEAVDALEIHDVRANFPDYPWKLCIGGNGLNTQIANQAPTGIIINTWTTADAGNTFQIVDIEEKPLFDAINTLTTLVTDAKKELVSKHKLTLQTTDVNAPFYLSATEQGDAPISAANDNNPGTYYGSTWGSTVGHHHYWQVDLADAANLEEFKFSYITRANGKDTPTQINVQGSVDGEEFTDILVLEGLPTAGGSLYVSEAIANEGYRYIRFEVPSTTTNFSAAGDATQEVTIAIAEFFLLNVNSDSYTAHDQNVDNAIVAAEAVLNASNNTLQSVQTAIDEFNAALVLGQISVNYSFTYKGVEKITQTTGSFVGEKWPAVTASIPFGLSAIKPEGTIAESDVVEGVANKTIELTENLPFVAAADYASITKWYYLKIKDASYLSYAAGLDYIDLANKSAVDASNKDAYTWAFIGNPFDGFQVVNKAAGSDKILSSSTTMNGASGEETWPIMTETPVAEGYNTYWMLTATTANIANGFFMGQKGFANNRMNNRGNKLAYWTGGADAGSTFTVEERDLSGATELQAVIDQVKAFVTAGVADATTVGYITSESVDNVAAALAVAEQAVATKTNCLEAQIALEVAVAAVQTVQPEEGKFYVIASAMPETDARSGKKMFVNNDGYMHFQAEDTFANVFQFVKKEGKLYLCNVQSGAYLNTAKGHGEGQHTTLAFDVENAKPVTIANMGRANVVSLIPEGGAMMHAQAAYSAVVAWDNSDNAGASSWIITELDIENYAHTVTIGESGYATLVLGYDAVIPAGVKAYAVSATGNDYATLSEVTGVLAAGEAVVLEAAAGDYQFKYTTEAATEVENNLLVGTVFNTNVEANAYMLSSKEGQAGFYKVALDVSTDPSNDETVTEGEGEEATTTTIPTYEAFKNNAFKAYLPVASEAAVLKINFGGNTTAIESVVNGLDVNAPIYDLSGRRVNAAVKGIYIQNGKKFIVK